MDLLSFFFFFPFSSLFQYLRKISWTQSTVALDFVEAMDDEYFFTSDRVSSRVRVLGNEEHWQPLESLFLVSQSTYANGRNKRTRFPQHASIPLAGGLYFCIAHSKVSKHLHLLQQQLDPFTTP